MISALNGEIGLRLAKTGKPDLILLDLILPKLHGFDVLKKLKEDSETKNIPIIILTNLGQMEDVEKALELGATTYLVKTQYALKDLINKVKEILSK